MKTNVQNTHYCQSLRVIAETLRVKWHLDECGHPIISGKFGEIGENGDGKLNACFHGKSGEPFSRLRAHRIRTSGNHGQKVSGGPDSDEALFAFNPSNQGDLNFFITALGITPKRRVSSETLERLTRLRQTRQGLAGRPFRGIEVTNRPAKEQK